MEEKKRKTRKKEKKKKGKKGEKNTYLMFPCAILMNVPILTSLCDRFPTLFLIDTLLVLAEQLFHLDFVANHEMLLVMLLILKKKKKKEIMNYYY